MTGRTAATSRSLRTTEATGQEADDRFEHGDNSIDNGHQDTSDGVDDRHDASTDGLETGDDGTHVCGVVIGDEFRYVGVDLLCWLFWCVVPEK